MPEHRYVLSERAANAVRALIAPGSGYSSRQRLISNIGANVQGCQWRITSAPAEVAEGEPPAVSVSVSPGIVAWGAGVNYANPGARDLGTLAPGSSARVVWITAAPPLPLVHDPRWPTGGAPECSDPECDCPEREGDPAGEGGDAGALLLVADDWTAPDGTTDVREIGTVAVSDAGGVSIVQLQRDTIVARAIVGRKPGGEDPEDDNPPCGNPLNDENDYNPLDHGSESGHGWRPWDGDRNPLDEPGEGGYTPTCRDNVNTATA